MERRISLEQIEIPTPCTADWGAMVGDDQKRFCGHCQKHVHNLSAMTRTAAEALVCESAAHLCVQFQKDVTGKMITLDYAPVVKQSRWMRWGPTAAVMSAFSTLLVLMGLSEPQPPAIAGQIMVSPPATQPTPLMGTPIPSTQKVMGEVAESVRGEMVAPMIKGKMIAPPTTQPEQ